MNVALAKTDTGSALGDIFAAARNRLPGAGKVAEARKEAFEAYQRPACRTGGSRNGNTPICGP